MSDSIWKKEISLGRKKKADPPAVEQPVARPKPEQVSFWKKEISLGGNKKQKEVERLAHEAAAAVAPTPEELRVPAPAPIEPEVLPVVEEPAPPDVAVSQAEPAAPAVAPEPPAPVAPVAPVASSIPEPEPVVTTPALEPLPEPPPLPPGAEVVFTAPALAPEPQPVAPPAPPAPEPVAPAPVAPPAPEPVAAAPVEPPAPPQPLVERPIAVPPAPAPEPWNAAPTLPPEPVTPAPTAGLRPPVPAAELPPLPEAEPKVPFWKKEIGGKKKQRPAATVTPAAEKVPFWKKEIGGKKKQQPAATAVAPAAEKVPFWKKELGGKKKQQPAATATATAPVAAKVPFWKKELGGKKKKSASTEVVVAAPKAKGEPFWKRGLELPSLPTRSRAQKAGASGAKSSKNKRLVGLKVGASQIAAARVVNNGFAELVQVARQPLEQGIVVGGELRDPDRLTEQLKSFFARNKLPKKNVRLGIASNRIGVRIFDVAGIADDKALTNAIQFRAQEALPIPLDEAVLDYHVLGETTNEEGQPVRRILLVVAYRELVERYIAACRKAGISLMGIDLEAFALLRALAAPREEGVEASAALVGVSIGHERSTFAVSDGRVCEFTRVLEWGGASLSIAIARALDMAPSEVEQIKRALTLEEGGTIPAGLTDVQWAGALDAVRKQLQTFARELVSSLQFYQNQPGSLDIGEIVITGGTAHLPGLAEELQRLIGVRVRVGDPLARLKVAKKVGTPDQVGSLAVAIGLGIED